MLEFITPGAMLLAAVALLVGALVARAVSKKSASQNQSSEMEARDVAEAIRDYFQKSGVSVAVSAAQLDGSRHYTAMVESEPMKRFRLSHLVEKSLAEHVNKVCGLHLEKVYWRFPIKENPPAAASEEQKDEYINEGLLNLKDLSNYEIVDSSIEIFEATKRGPG